MVIILISNTVRDILQSDKQSSGHGRFVLLVFHVSWLIHIHETCLYNACFGDLREVGRAAIRHKWMETCWNSTVNLSNLTEKSFHDGDRQHYDRVSVSCPVNHLTVPPASDINTRGVRMFVYWDTLAHYCKTQHIPSQWWVTFTTQMLKNYHNNFQFHTSRIVQLHYYNLELHHVLLQKISIVKVYFIKYT